MATQVVYIYQPEDYVGELNLIALERRITVRELKRTQHHGRAAKLLGCSERSMVRKLQAHQIKEEEWKFQQPKLEKKKAWITNEN